MAYLTDYQLIPLERATEIIKDLKGYTISQGTSQNCRSSKFSIGSPYWGMSE